MQHKHAMVFVLHVRAIQMLILYSMNLTLEGYGNISIFRYPVLVV